MKVNLFLLDRITGKHVHFIFVMNFAKFVLYFCCYLWIFYSLLRGEFDIFPSGVFFYLQWVRTSQCISLSFPWIRNIWFQYLSLPTLYLLTTELKLNDGKENSQRIKHRNMNTSNFTRSWLNLYDILYRWANANATVFVFNWKVNIREQRCLILFA